MAIKLSTMVRNILKDKKQELPAAGILAVTDSGEVLLTKRQMNTQSFPGCWSVPSGTYDEMIDDESIEKCARREFFEETSHMIPDTHELFFVDKYDGNGRTYFLYIYRVPNKFNIRIDFEHDEWSWFSTDYLPANIAPQILDAISKIGDIY